MEITRLTHLNEAVLTEINSLLLQLSSSGRQATQQSLEMCLADKNTYVFVASDAGRVIAMASLVLIRVPSGIGARVEDVIVDETYRGQGLGERLLLTVIKQAKELGVSGIELTSRSSREAANKLYQKLGFERKDTNVYRMKP